MQLLHGLTISEINVCDLVAYRVAPKKKGTPSNSYKTLTPCMSVYYIAAATFGTLIGAAMFFTVCHLDLT